MESRNNDCLSIATSSDDSVTLYLSSTRSNDKSKVKRKKSRRRACPILALLGILLYFVTSGSGVAISVLVVKFELETDIADQKDLSARILLFVASCLGIVYVLLHVISARQHYVRKKHASAQVYGYFTVSVAIMVARLSLPAWIATVVMHSLVAAKLGLNVRKGVKGNVEWFELGIAALSLLSLVAILIATETSNRPFATFGISKRSFVRGEKGHKRQETFNTFERSVSQAGMRAARKESAENDQRAGDRGISGTNQEGTSFDRSRIQTPESPIMNGNNRKFNHFVQRADSSDRRHSGRSDKRPAMVRIRSQPVPTPLETIFGSKETLPLAGRNTESPGISRGDFSWRPPTRDSHLVEQQRQHVCEMYHETLRPKPGDEDLISHYEHPASIIADTRPPLHPSTVATRFPKQSESSQRLSRTGILRDSLPPPQIELPPPPPVQLQQRRPTLPTLDNLSVPVQSHKRRSTLPNLSAAPAQPQQRRPTLPSLNDLSTRAAARRRNSLLVREADLNPNPRLSDMSKRWTSIGMVTPTTSDFIEVPRPEITHREVQRDPEDGSILEDHHPLSRNNTTRSHLVRNFSRPGAARRKRSDSEAGQGGVRKSKSFQVKPQNGDAIVRTERRIKRSSSVPPVWASKYSMETNTLVEVGSQFEQPPDASAPRRGPPPAAVVAPRSSMDRQLPLRQLTKGLGQGSNRRLDLEVERWQQGMGHPTVAERRGVNVFGRRAPVAAPAAPRAEDSLAWNGSGTRVLLKDDTRGVRISRNF